MRWPSKIRIIRIPWGEEKPQAIQGHLQPQEPESGTARLRQNFDNVLRAIRSGEPCGNQYVEVVLSAASAARVRVIIPLERDDDEGYWLQTALFDELKDAMAYSDRTRGKALRNALSDAGVQVMYLDRARSKPFGEPDWHEEGRLLM
ncbi:hypothetical protein FJY94_04715 [Candidatus Kaiserbacteria bacterium]|nr:hypothetical protein [Candidatus Kaiserbacteria bacterium]